ncbi:MAG: DNA polymerase III subunit epsilon [Gammaproteobacteria bacterium]|uniref:exonuclease domain-containing protein n=1 Tax=Rhodoferax sp. TaxID=50421 RepID=UPI001809C20C|nr:exonuclease domain-containing protein [Rhodoferax sp.]MBU3901017.1 DNA polymerase III subunit epsilon [Gammaproteobacteria bacterium]MBA3058291.1 DNA polymerase III subunit epsilon [Rhodoferax sp.]MBU3996754.1 DNA polymerase III subunit epsilon [Gammaproteobacteria bacterium]MBU4017691.1 DNA polymerase III subunit epsilon [Gammaproteobacteria bacterium]MBU4081134.1 DNA polymerase III subunit epsilon [Gammaproteobacteria bacterium]
MLPCYVLLDLETTGGNPVIDRITEIAAVRIENGQEVARWSTLVNPGCSISPFIQRLTGISNAMVRSAPSFEAVAPRLLELLGGAVLVAHNVRFDHGFLLHELARLDVALRVKTLCTVRLSRLLYPQHKGHGLDALMQRHGISTLERHRAMGDVEVMQAWLLIARQEHGAQLLQQQALALLQSSAALPPQLETPVADIPETAGVYIFYGEGPLPLYIGKSVKLRSRVMSHFQASSRSAREMRMAQEIRRVQWVETAGELGALLLEARLVKEKQPVYNRQLRRESTLCAWRLAHDPLARPLLSLVRGASLQPQEFGQMYGVYRSKNQAISSLRELADKHSLCLQALGLESGKGRCFAHQIGRCQGVCCGQETPQRHHLRLQLALAQQKLQVWPYAGRIGLREYDAHSRRTDIHIFEQWCHLATVHDESELADALGSRSTLAFDLDTYRLLLKHMALAGTGKIELLDWAKKLQPTLD